MKIQRYWTQHALDIGVDWSSSHARNEDLEQQEKMVTLGHLVSAIAHDFNNQLCAIIGNADLLTEATSAKECNSLGRDILEAALHSADLTKQLLGFARKSTDDAIRTDVNAVVQNVVAILERTLPKNMALWAPPPTGKLEAVCKAGQLQSAVLNLALNARDAMPGGGTMSIAVTCERVTEPEGRTFSLPVKAGTYACVAVQDTGMGITPEALPHLFEPFYTTKERGRGTGMGLTSVFNTLQAHAGGLHINSTLGQGSVFRIYFPVVAEHPPTPTTATVAGCMVEPDRLPQSVLFVDDEASIRSVAVKMLRKLGVSTVHVFDGGTSAMEWYTKHHAEVEVILLDLLMPPPDGQAVCRAMRGYNPAARIILMSGNRVCAKEENPLARSGNVQFLAKPFDTRALQRALLEAQRFNCRPRSSVAPP